MVVAPAVDGFQRTGVVGEIQIVDPCGIVLPDDIPVRIKQRPAVIHEDGVGKGEPCFPVHGGKLAEHRSGKFVHGVRLRWPVTEDLADFFGGLPPRPVQDHTQQELKAERGNDIVTGGRRPHAVNQVEGEGMAFFDKTGGAGGQFKRLVGIILILGRLSAGETGQERGGGKKGDRFHKHSSIGLQDRADAENLEMIPEIAVQ